MILGFTSGHAVEGDPGLLRLHPRLTQSDHRPVPLRPRARCIRLDMAPQEAMKMIISGGNYVPRALGAATAGGPRL